MVTARRGKAKAGDAATDAAGATAQPMRVLKKYPNRRLYDTQTSSYITLADVKRMVLDGVGFEVQDAKTQEDLTRAILLQIILEEETGGVPMFSTSSLAQIIRFYGHAMQGVMGGLLERQMQAFTDLQSRFTEQVAEQTPGMPFSPEAWAQFMGAQSPMLQAMMGAMKGDYAEQSKSLLSQWQEQMERAGAIFPGMAGFGAKKS